MEKTHRLTRLHNVRLRAETSAVETILREGRQEMAARIEAIIYSSRDSFDLIASLAKLIESA